MNASVKPPSEKVLTERAQRLAARPVEKTEAQHRRVCVCQAGGELIGLPVEDVERVMTYAEPAPLADAEPSLLGIISQRGGFALVYSLARLLGHALVQQAADAHVVVLRRRRPLSALSVARALIIKDIEIVRDDEAASVPTRAEVIAYGRHEGAIVSIIDIAALLRSGADARFGGQN